MEQLHNSAKFPVIDRLHDLARVLKNTFFGNGVFYLPYSLMGESFLRQDFENTLARLWTETVSTE